MRTIKDKRGAEFTISTLVVIVLAIIVLVVLALGFGTGWGNLWSKISGYFSPVNVDAVSQACQYACTTKAKFDYCCRVREVRFEEGGDGKLLTCNSGEGVLGVDCGSFNCDVLEDCSELVCSGEVKSECGDEEDESKKFDSTGKIIEEGMVCCVSE